MIVSCDGLLEVSFSILCLTVELKITHRALISIWMCVYSSVWVVCTVLSDLIVFSSTLDIKNKILGCHYWQIPWVWGQNVWSMYLSHFLQPPFISLKMPCSRAPPWPPVLSQLDSNQQPSLSRASSLQAAAGPHSNSLVFSLLLGRERETRSVLIKVFPYIQHI